MKKISQYKSLILLACCGLLMGSCNRNKVTYDASGTFEAVETIISSESAGTIKALDLEEGQNLQAGAVVGYVDSMQLYLKKKQLLAQIKALGSRLPDVGTQTDFYKQQIAVSQTRLNYLQNEQKRIQNLVKADAATPKQLDDITAQIDELKKQLLVISKQDAAQVSALKTQTSGLKSNVLPLYVQIEQLNDQLSKSRIINPVNGTVLIKYAESNEMATPGKALYKIADLSAIVLRAYITGDQLAKVKLNQKVKVLTDAEGGTYKTQEGVIEWISSKAEFTPKTIQTKDERANLVYAVKIKVKNDGLLKIGMYGEVVL